jgi:hypothetical protein
MIPCITWSEKARIISGWTGIFKEYFFSKGDESLGCDEWGIIFGKAKGRSFTYRLQQGRRNRNYAAQPIVRLRWTTPTSLLVGSGYEVSRARNQVPVERTENSRRRDLETLLIFYGEVSLD